MAISLGLKSSVYPLHVGGSVYAMYAAVPALLLNLAVAVVLTVAVRVTGLAARPAVYGSDLTASEAYAD
jgi:SSS family solute:Na+ symporter